MQPVVPHLPIAGPSKPKQGATHEPTKATAKPEVKVESSTSTVNIAKEKQKSEGKLNFSMKAKEAKKQEEVKKMKKESTTDVHKMMFFPKPVEKSPTAAPAASVKVEKEREKEPIVVSAFLDIQTTHIRACSGVSNASLLSD